MPPLIEPDLLALDPAIVRWRVASTWPKAQPTEGELVPYVDARRVADRLDLIDPEWSTTLTPDPTGKGLIRGLTLRGVTRFDVGQISQIEGYKGAASDSLKRCAFLFGIFRELYDLPKIIVQVDERRRPKGGKPRYIDGTWRAPRGGRIRDDHPSVEERAAETAPARDRPAPPADDTAAIERRRRHARSGRIREMVTELDQLGSRDANRYSVRAHVRKVYEVDDLAAFYEAATLDALDELGLYVAGKLSAARAAKEREDLGGQADVEDVPQAEPTDADYLAEGLRMARAQPRPRQGSRR